MLRNIIDNITTTEVDKKLASFAEESARTLNDIKALETESDVRLFGYLESISNNLNRLAIHFTGMADDVDKMLEYMSVFSEDNAKAFEEQKRKDALEAAKTEVDLEVGEGPASKSESMVEKVMSRIAGLFVLLDVLIPFAFGFLEKIFGKTGAIAAVGAFLLLQVGIISKVIGGVFGAIASRFKDILRGATKVPTTIKGVFASIGDVFKDMLKGIKALPLKNILAKALKVIPVVGTLIAAAISGTEGAIEGFEEGGMVGAVRGGLAGIVSGILGWVGDFAGWLVGNLLKLLGFDEIGEQIVSFDFTGLVSDAVKGLFDHVLRVIMLPLDIIKSLAGAIVKSAEVMVGSFMRLMSGDDLASVLFDAFRSIIASVLDSLTSIAADLVGWLPRSTGLIDSLNKTRASVGLPALEGGSENEEEGAEPQLSATEQMSAGMAVERADGSGIRDGFNRNSDIEAQKAHDAIMSKRVRVESLTRRGAAESDIKEAQAALNEAVDAARESGTLAHMGVEDRAEELKSVSQTHPTSSYGITSNDSNQRNSVTAATSENLVSNRQATNVVSENLVSNRQATNVASENLRVDEKLDVVVAPKTSTQAAAESRARLETNDALIKRPAQQTSVNAVNAPSVSQASVTNHTYSGNQPKAFGIATA